MYKLIQKLFAWLFPFKQEKELSSLVRSIEKLSDRFKFFYNLGPNYKPEELEWFMEKIEEEFGDIDRKATLIFTRGGLSAYELTQIRNRIHFSKRELVRMVNS